MLILESSPNSLDLRQGTDVQSERTGSLILDSLVKKDAHFNLQPWLAASWNQPDALTWIFHLRDGVHFHDGRPLEAADVAWTIQSLIDPALTASLPGGTLISPKSGSFAAVDHAEARDRLTVIVHLKRPDAGLLFNMSDGLFGVVPRGSGPDFGLAPIGSGPFRFVSQVQDKEVVLERAPGCWSEPSGLAPYAQLEFNVVPDTITSALEIQKGSADAASNVLTLDMIYSLRNSPTVEVSASPGSNIWYLNFNVADPALADRRVRQAIALAIDRSAIVASLWTAATRAAGAWTIRCSPPGHWATADASDLAQYPHDPARAQALLESAGYSAPARWRPRIHLYPQDQHRRVRPACSPPSCSSSSAPPASHSPSAPPNSAPSTPTSPTAHSRCTSSSGSVPTKTPTSSATCTPRPASHPREPTAATTSTRRSTRCSRKPRRRDWPLDRIQSPPPRRLHRTPEDPLHRHALRPALVPVERGRPHSRRLSNVTAQPDGNFDFLR